MAKDAGPLGITGNAIYPGLVLTELVRRGDGKGLGLSGFDEVVARYRQDAALGWPVTRGGRRRRGATRLGRRVGDHWRVISVDGGMAGYKQVTQVTQVHAAAAAGGDRTQGTEPDYSSPSPTNAPSCRGSGIPAGRPPSRVAARTVIWLGVDDRRAVHTSPIAVGPALSRHCVTSHYGPLIVFLVLVADFRKFTVLMSYCSQAVTHIWCIVERVKRLPGQNRGSGTYGVAVRRRGA